jgi:AcrR family transcriptional regulator
MYRSAMEPTLSLVERRKQETARDIVATAVELIDRDGFENTTVETIAAAAGCSPRTIYRYFGTKEELIFHDLPEVIAGLGTSLQARLEAGQLEWAALTEALVEFIGRFDVTNPSAAVSRMELWLREPLLKARYLQYVDQAEQMVLDVLCRYRGTKAKADDVAQLMAVASIGAYRITMATHRATRGKGKLAVHLRQCMDTLAAGLGSAG